MQLGMSHCFLVRTLQAQILVADPLVVVCVVLAAIRTVKALAQATVQVRVLEVAQVRVLEVALVHAIIPVKALAQAIALVHVVVHAQTTALVAALVVMVVVVVVTAAVPLAPANAGTVTALVPAQSIAMMKLLAVTTVITSVATLNGKDWRLAHGRTNYSSNG
jgi:hypothetical protein